MAVVLVRVERWRAIGGVLGVLVADRNELLLCAVLARQAVTTVLRHGIAVWLRF
jgi:hypothetical protein